MTSSFRVNFMGKCDQKSTEEILDYFVGAGGNFIDTSNNYQVRASYILLWW
jgi:aryl-alcohol dehydrogenase-like predicted oxidoreductase